MTSSPVLSRRQLGSELRRLREGAGVTVARAAKELDCSPSKISRIETGVTAPRRPEIESLVRLFGDAGADARDELVRLAGEGKQSAWYDEYSDMLEPGSTLHRYIGLEGGATRIREFSCQWLPGLLQTEEFARAVFAVTDPSRSAAEADRLISYRLARQQALQHASEPLVLQALLDECVVRRPALGDGVMRRQLEHLARIVDQASPNVEVRMLPFDIGLHGLLGGEFTVMSFDQDEEDIVYFEGQEGGLFQEKPDVVRRHSERWEIAWKSAIEGSDLAALLRRIGDTFS